MATNFVYFVEKLQNQFWGGEGGVSQLGLKKQQVSMRVSPPLCVASDLFCRVRLIGLLHVAP